MSRYSKMGIGDRIYQAISDLNGNAAFPRIGFGTSENMEFPLQYSWETRMIWADLEKCRYLPEDTLLGAIAHEYAHGETHCMKFGNPYVDLPYCARSKSEEIVLELQDLLEKLRREWRNENVCQMITGYRTLSTYELPMNCIEGKAGELISKLEAQDDDDSKWWLDKRLPLYVRTMKYYACGRHDADFNQYNQAAAYLLQLKEPLQLGLDDVEWFEEVF